MAALQQDAICALGNGKSEDIWMDGSSVIAQMTQLVKHSCESRQENTLHTQAPGVCSAHLLNQIKTQLPGGNDHTRNCFQHWRIG